MNTMGGRHWLVVAQVVAIATAAPALGDPASEREAKLHVRRGVELYERGELDQSIEELEHANRIEVTADGCYALGQALRKKGDCTRAIESYRCAVERAPSEEFARAANYQIGRCVVEGGLEREPAGPPTVTFIAPPEAPADVKPRWYRDTAGGILFVIGLGAAGAGGGLLVHAEARASSSRDSLDAFREADSVPTERLAGVVSLSVGAVLVIGSIVRYAVVARQ